MNIALVGYFGHDNLGDEAILQSVLQQLKKYHVPLRIIVFTQTPQETSRRYKVIAFRRKSWPDLLAGITMTDVVVFAGGSLLQDKTSFKSLLYYLSIIFLARIFKKKIILYAQGIEDFRYPLSKWLVKTFLGYTHFISVRDEESYKYLKDVLKIKKPVHYTVDSALMLCPLQTDNRYLGYIGLNFIDIENFPYKNVSDTLVKFSREHNKKYVYIPFHEEDLKIAGTLQQLIPSQYFEVLQPQENISMLIGIMQQLDMVIGTRLHSLILSAAAYTPFMGIHYHDKVESFAKEVKQKYMLFDNLQNGHFYSNLVDVFSQKESYKNQLKFLVEDLKTKSKNNLINNIIIKYDKT
ncbi:MAG: polysaccharide pyruvyl transferase CsaB [Candidatus Margulisbacteria bacterium]|nr:polysaccharide pyruvyl transferase CsaB [Candidatus Margulisiibacteriota bacterium]